MNADPLAIACEDESIDAEIDGLFASFDPQRLKAIDRTLRRRSESAPSLARLERMHRLCLLYAHNSRAVDGYLVARAAVRAARRLGDRRCLRRALTVRGALRRIAGDINGAIEDNVEAYELARELNDEAIVAPPLSNLILALGYLDLDDLALRLADEALERVPSSFADFSHLSSTTSLMVNASDLLLGKNPRRALQLACEVERRLREAAGGLGPSDEVQRDFQLAIAAMNQVIAAVNLRDGGLAALAVARLRGLIDGLPMPRLQPHAAVTLAVYETRYGDRRRGLLELRRACQSDLDEIAVDASRRLVEYYEATGCPAEAAEVLRALQARLQSIRRTVALEELRRIEALDEVEEFDEFQCETQRRLADFAGRSIGVPERLAAKLKHLEGIAVAAELREGAEMSRAQHVYRVGKLCRELAVEAGCSDEVQWLAEITGRLHDIGKCAIPDSTILCSSPLHEAMQAMLREHSDYGARLIADADEPRLVQVVASVRHHHERFDGGGYPSRLRGDEIPLLARIAAICESYDAMLQSRVYRSSRAPAAALQEIERCAGTQFDPQLAGLFARLVRRIRREHGDVLEYLGAESRDSAPVRTFEQLEQLTAEARAVL
jgi:HD-GYP domain-containing protein (c-di-GMP phosphodiesterase class II)